MSEETPCPFLPPGEGNKLTRREFLKAQALGAAALAVASSGLLLPKTGLAGGFPDIAVARGESIKAFRAALEMMGGIKAFVKPGNTVLIKPNMSHPHPMDAATNTDPLLVRELALLCREAGASKIVIADYPFAKPEKSFATSGIEAACKDLPDTRLLGAVTESLYTEKSIPGGVAIQTNGFLKEALTADVLIAFPIAKSHADTGVSLALKGMMGLVWDRGIMHRTDISKSIVDICSILKPHLTIIDATRILADNGPAGPGTVKWEKTVIASKDPVAADAYATSAFEWYGKKYVPKQVGHIRMAAERGLGRMDLEKMTIKQVTV